MQGNSPAFGRFLGGFFFWATGALPPLTLLFLSSPELWASPPPLKHKNSILSLSVFKFFANFSRKEATTLTPLHSQWCRGINEQNKPQIQETGLEGKPLEALEISGQVLTVIAFLPGAAQQSSHNCPSRQNSRKKTQVLCIANSMSQNLICLCLNPNEVKVSYLLISKRCCKKQISIYIQ